jgi:hypothetical protein
LRAGLDENFGQIFTFVTGAYRLLGYAQEDIHARRDGRRNRYSFDDQQRV